MSVLEPIPDTQQWKGRLAFWLQLASLFATGWLLWRPAMLHRWPHYTVTLVLLQAALNSLAACAAGGAITLILYLLLLQDREDVVQATLRTSKAAVWFAPAVILMADLSPAALVAGVVLVINATRVLYGEWRSDALSAAPIEEEPGEPFARFTAETPIHLRRMAPALAASFCAQAGAAAILLHHAALAGMSLVASAAILTVFAQTSRAVEPPKPASVPRSVLGLALTIVLAIGLTVGGMYPRFVHPGRGGFGDGNGGSASSPVPAGLPQGAGQGPAERFPDAAGYADGGFPGVILWPEIKPYATLIAPMPQTHGALGATAAPLRPLSIPFSGEYWMYRWPFSHPPRSSYFQRGTPSKLSFSTTDRRPMQMEARHKLDQSIALDCCNAIRMEIRNGDRYLGTVNLELVLVDNESGRPQSLRLGRVPVISQPKITGDDVTPVTETLEFPIPGSASIASFDELRVNFLRNLSRADKSARISIERFILVPRPM